MAALTCNPARVSAVFLDRCHIRTYLVGPGGVTAGQAVCVTAAGRAIPANTATAGKEQVRGIALETMFEGQGVDVLEDGFVAGFDLSGLAYDALVYGNDADGAIGTAAGTKAVPIGRVAPLSDRDPSGNPSKVLRIRPSVTQNY